VNPTEARLEARLGRLRGRALARPHNARTISALATNPGCGRRALMDAAGMDEQKLADYTADQRHGTMFDHPLLRISVRGRHAYLEPDLIAFQWLR